MKRALRNLLLLAAMLAPGWVLAQQCEVTPPVSYNFENDTEYEMPACWTLVSGDYAAVNNDWSEGQYLNCYNSMIATPAINHAANDLQVSFKHRYTNDLRIGIMPANGTQEAIQWLDTINNYQDDWTEETIYTLSATAITGSVKIVFDCSFNWSSLQLDDVVISQAPSCFPLTSLAYSNVSPTGATLSWSGTSAQYRVVWQNANNATDIDSATVSTTSYTLSGLTTQTPYTVSVYGVCGATDWSTARSVNFTTTCEATSTLPTWTFEDGTVNEAPNCWQILSGSDAEIQDDGDGNQYLYLYGTTIATQPIAAASDSLYVSFKYQYDDVHYGIVAAGGSINDVQWIGYTDYPDNWSDFAFNTEGIVIPGNVSLVFAPSYSWGGINIDSIVVKAFTGCKAPANAWAVGDSTTDHAALVVWDNASADGGYDVLLSTQNYNGWTDPNAISLHTADTFATFNGLSENTEYYIYVRTVCSNYDVPWKQFYSFQTRESYRTINNISLSDRQYVSLRIYWNTGYGTYMHDAVGYRVAIRQQGTTAWSEYDVSANTFEYTFTGLDEAVTYEVRVAVVADDEAVIWSKSLFYTTNGCPLVNLGTDGTNQLPYYNDGWEVHPYCVSQQIVTAEALANLGDTLSGVSFLTHPQYNDTAEAAHHVNLYLANSERSSFDYGDYEPIANFTLVAENALLDLNNGVAHITFNAPFVRNPEQNLIVMVYDSTVVRSQRNWMANYSGQGAVCGHSATPFTLQDDLSMINWENLYSVNTLVFDVNECVLPEVCEVPSLSKSETDTGYIFNSSITRNDYYWNFDFRPYRDNNWNYFSEEEYPWQTVADSLTSGSFAFNTTQLRSDYQYAMRVWRQSEQCPDMLISSPQYFYGSCQTPTVNYNTLADDHRVLTWNKQPGAEYTVSYMESSDYYYYPSWEDFQNATVIATGITVDTFLVNFDLPNSKRYYFFVSRLCGEDTLYGYTYFYGNVFVPQPSYHTLADNHRVLTWNKQVGAEYTVSYMERNGYYYYGPSLEDFRNATVVATGITVDTFLVNFDLPSDREYCFFVSRLCGEDTVYGYTYFNGNIQKPNLQLSYDAEQQGRIKLFWYTDQNWVWDPETSTGHYEYVYDTNVAYTLDYRIDNGMDDPYMPIAVVDDTNAYTLDFDLPGNNYYNFRLSRSCGDSTISTTSSTSGNCGIGYVSSSNTDSGTVIYWQTVNGVSYYIDIRTSNEETYTRIDTVIGDGNTRYQLFSGYPQSTYYYVRVSRVCGGEIYEGTRSFNGDVPGVTLYENISGDTNHLYWDSVYGEYYRLLYYNGNEWTVWADSLQTNSYFFTTLNSDRSYEFRVGRYCAHGISYGDAVYIGGTCHAPSLALADATTNSLTVQWAGDGETAYLVRLFNSENRPLDTLYPAATDTSCTFNNLQPTTSYNIVITRECFSGLVGNTLRARTLCAPLSIPYSMNFNDWYYGNADNTTYCWRSGVKTTADSHEDLVYGPNFENVSGTMMLAMRHGVYLMLPEFADPLNSLQLTVDFAGTDSTYVVLGVTSDQDSASDFVALDTLHHSDFGTDAVVRAVYRFDEELDNGKPYVVLMAPIDTVNQDYVRFAEVTMNEKPYCIEVHGVAVTAVTDSSAALTWDAGDNNVIEYVIEYGRRGFSLGSGQRVYSPTNSVVIPQLMQGTDYQAYVYANCGRVGMSDASSRVSFTTECGPTYYVSQSFYSSDLVGKLPNCWTADTLAGGPMPCVIDGDENYGGTILRANDSTILVLPELRKNLNEYTFYMYATFNGGFAELGTVAHNGTGFASTFVPVDTIDVSGSYTRYMDDMESTRHFYALRFHGTAYIRNIQVYDLPACFAPENLTASDVTQESVILDWDDHVEATKWRITYSDSRYHDTTVYQHPVTIAGLQSVTNYYFDVTTVCGNNSSDSRSLYMQTLPPCSAPTNVHVVSATADSVFIDLDGPYDGIAQWNVEVRYSQPGWGSQYDYYSPTTHPFAVATPYEGINYSITVSSTCEENGYTTGNVTIVYTPECQEIAVTRENPWYESFDSYYSYYGQPVCWSISGTGYATPGSNRYDMGSTDEVAGNVRFSSPRFNLEDKARLNFVYRAYNYYYPVTFQVEFLNAQGAVVKTSDTILVSDTYNVNYVDTLPQSCTQFAIHYFDTTSEATSSRRLILDNFSLQLINRTPCMGLNSMEIVEGTQNGDTAHIRLLDNDTVVFGQMEIRLRNEDTYEYVTSADGSIIFNAFNIADSSYTVTNLMTGTRYMVDARMWCDFDGEGQMAPYDWQTVGYFATPCSIITELPHTFKPSLDSSCWSYELADSVRTSVADYNNLYLLDSGYVALNEAAFGLDTAYLSFNVYDFDDNAATAKRLVVGVVGEDGFVAVDTVDYRNNDYFETYFFGLNDYHRVAFRKLGGDAQLFNITLHERPSCMGVRDLAMTDTGSNSVTLDWTSIDPSTNHWMIQCSNNETYDVTAKPYTVTGLQPGKYYEFYVSSVCGEHETSYSEYIDVTTRCGAITSLPYEAEFNDYYGMPSCWSMDTVTNASIDRAYTYYGYYYLQGNVTVATPLVNLDLGGAMLTFNVGLNNNDGLTHLLEVGTVDSVEEGFSASFVPLLTINSNNYNNNVTLYFEGVGSGKHIALRTTSPEGSYTRFYVNNFRLDELPGCANIDNLHVAAATETSITLDWRDMSTQNSGWLVRRWNSDGYWQIDTVESHPVTISGLQHSSQYEFNVSNVCYEETYGYTNWNYITAYTECGVNTELPLTSNFNGNYSYSSYPTNLTGEMPRCWGYDAASVAAGQLPPQVCNWYYNGNRILMGYNEMVYGPAFQSDIEHYYVEFNLSAPNDDLGVNSVKMVLGTYNAGQFTALDTVTYDGENGYFKRHIVADMSEGAHFAFKAVADTFFMIDDVTISRAPSCDAPDSMVVTAATTSTLTLDWNGGNATQWELSYNSVTKIVNQHPYTVTNLRPGTDYYFMLRAVCGENDYTDYTNAMGTTDCDVVTSLPVTYDFDNDATGQLPWCWAYDPGASVLDSNNSHASTPTLSWYSSTHGNVLTMDYAGTLALPVMAVPVNTLTVEYDVIEVGGTDGMLIIGMVDGNAEGFDASFMPKDTLHYNEANIIGHHSTTFSAANGDRVAFRTVSATTGWSYVVIDSVTVSTSLEPCVAPTELAITNIGINDVTLTWNTDSTDATTWEIVLDNGNDYYNLFVVNSNPVTLTGLEPGTRYHVNIRSICGADSVRGDWSDWSLWFTTRYCDAPAPTGLIANLNNDTVTLSWTKTNANDSLWHIRAYITGMDPTTMLVYGLDSAKIASGNYYFWYNVDTMPYSFVLPSNSSFNIGVANICDPVNGGIGTMSEFVPVTITPADCPSFSNIAMLDVTESRATFNWTDGFGDINRRVVVVPADSSLESGNYVFSQWTDTTVMTVTGLEPNTSYDLYIYAWCTSYNLVISEPYSFTTEAICYHPTGLTATDTTATSITVSWSTQAPATLVAIAMGNELAADADGETVTTTTHTFSDLLPDTTYTIGVRSECETTWHTLTLKTDTLAQGQTIECNEPSLLVVTDSTESTLTISWTTQASTTRVAIAAAGAWADGKTTNMTSATTYTFSGLQPATAYTVGVQSLCSEDWVTLNVSTANCPSAAVATISNVTTNSATVSWTDASGAAYRIEYGEAGFTQGNGTVANATVNPYTLTGLEPATAYEVYLLRQCVDTLWEVSEAASFTTATPCYAPSALTATDTTTNSISVSWSTQADSTLVAIAEGTTLAADAAGTVVTTTTYTFMLLQPNTIYTIGVRSLCETAWHTLTVRTDTVPEVVPVCPSPTNLATTATIHTVTATWNTTADSTLVAISQGTAIAADAQVVTTTATTHIFQNLLAGTQYTVGVRSACDTAWLTSTVTTAEEPDTTVACPVYSNLTATTTTTSLTATWTTTADSSKVGLCQGDSWIASTTMEKVFGTAKTFTGLQPNTTYTVAVMSYCNDTLLTYTVATLDSTVEVCNVPQNVAVSDVTTNSASVSWTAVDGNTTYEVRLTYGSNSSTVTVNGTSHSFGNLEANTTYSVAVRTVCDAAAQRYSDWSDEVSFTTLTVGIDDVESTVDISLYPNPATTSVTLSGIEGQATVTIVDFNGRVSGEWRVESEKLTIDVSSLASGAYFVRIVGDQTNAIRKLIVR